MDEVKRVEVAARRTASAQRAQNRRFEVDRAKYVSSVPILANLERHNEPYNSFGYDRLTGPLNWWANAPDRWPISVKNLLPMPMESPGRAELILKAIRAAAHIEEDVVIIVRSEELVVTLPLNRLDQYADLLIENHIFSGLGFCQIGADWAIEASPTHLIAGALNSAD